MPAAQTFIAALGKLRLRPPSAALPATLARVAESAYVRAGIEPPLREVLRDPIVRAVMRGDGVEPAEMRRVLKAARQRRRLV